MLERKSKRTKSGPRKGYYVLENEPDYNSPSGDAYMNVDNSESVDNQGVAPY